MDPVQCVFLPRKSLGSDTVDSLPEHKKWNKSRSYLLSYGQFPKTVTDHYVSRNGGDNDNGNGTKSSSLPLLLRVSSRPRTGSVYGPETVSVLTCGTEITEGEDGVGRTTGLKIDLGQSEPRLTGSRDSDITFYRLQTRIPNSTDDRCPRSRVL